MNSLRFFEKLDHIDNFISSVGEYGYDKTFTKIVPYLENSHVCQYFFDNIDNEGWVDVVTNSEFLERYRSGKISDMENNQFDWYFLSYLLKVAQKAPDQASAYLKSIAAIDDERLHERMIEIMLQLPCSDAAELAQNEVAWCRTKADLHGLYPKYAGKLILHIQECGEEVAFELIAELCEVDAELRETGESGSDNYHKSIDVKAKFSDWEYQALLGKYISKYVLRCNDYKPVLIYMCKVMSHVMDIEERDVANDYSWIWRNTLEDNEQTRHVSGIKEHLLVSLRDISISLIKDDRSRFEEITEVLSVYKWTIFRRLSIYLSVKFPEIDIELTKARLGDTSLYDDHRTRNEYSLLLGAAFDLVDQGAQKSVFTWIENGPNIDEFKSSVIGHTGNEPTKEEIETRIKFWQKDRLHLIRKYLHGNWLDKYNSLVEETGKPQHPEYSSYTTSWTGPTSPKSVDDIQGLSIGELVRYLKGWKPSGKDMEDSAEGLSRNVSEAIKTNIDDFKHSASLFKGLPPTYVRGMIQGIRDSIDSLDKQSWSEIFDLSKWVLLQVDDNDVDLGADFDEDPGWSWCRQAIASLIDAGLKQRENSISKDLREDVWWLINILIQDPDPTPAHEVEYGGSNMEPTSLAINTVRGEAMHALIGYGLWVARNNPNNNISFKNIPEMRRALDNHLDPVKDPSKAIRSVYGQFYPWLNLLDTNWVSEAKSRIFSDDELGLGDAAWDAYITFCQPYDEILKVIPDIYIKHIKRLSDFEESDDRERALENLTAHLITFFWRSKIELGDEIIQLFYQHAPLKLRKHAIKFIGRSLGNIPDQLDEKIEERLKALYEWRQTQADESKEYGEFEGFCWWVDADVIDKDWVLNKFYELLNVLDQIDHLDFAARNLGNFLDINPAKVLTCLSMMIDKVNPQQGMYFTWDDEARDILARAMLNNDVKEQAIDLIHKFGSKGFLKYRDLLVA